MSGAWHHLKMGVMGQEVKRNSDCYVFCVYTDQDKTNYHLLDMERRDFYVAAMAYLDRYFPEQKSISLSTVQNHFSPVEYRNLKKAIDHVLDF